MIHNFAIFKPKEAIGRFTTSPEQNKKKVQNLYSELELYMINLGAEL